MRYFGHHARSHCEYLTQAYITHRAGVSAWNRCSGPPRRPFGLHGLTLGWSPCIDVLNAFYVAFVVCEEIGVQVKHVAELTQKAEIESQSKEGIREDDDTCLHTCALSSMAMVISMLYMIMLNTKALNQLEDFLFLPSS